MTSSTSHVLLVTFQRLLPVAMIVPLLVPPATSVCLLMLPAMIRRLRPFAMTARPRSPLALPHDSLAQPANPPPCSNSTQHPH